MAKSLRSKWKRKMRAVKRKKNEVKELARLKKIVETSKHDRGSMIQDVIMSDLVVATDASKLTADEQPSTTLNEGEAMETNASQLRKYNQRTLQDEHGQYPIWMNQRAIRKKKNAATVVSSRARFKCGSSKKQRRK